MPRPRYRYPLFAAALLAAAAAGYFARRPGGPGLAAADAPAALLLIDPKPRLSLPGGPAMPPDEAEAFRRTQPALVRAEFVLNAALRDPKARQVEAVRTAPDAVAWLAERVTAEYLDGSTVLRVRVRGVPPADAAALANAVAGAYVELVRKAESQQADERLDQLQKAHGRLEERLRGAREGLRVLAAELGRRADRADQRALVADLRAERAAVRAELRQAGDGEKGKSARATLAELDARIQKCETASAELDRVRDEIESLAALMKALYAEKLRAELERAADGRSRVSVLAPAEAPAAPGG